MKEIVDKSSAMVGEQLGEARSAKLDTLIPAEEVSKAALAAVLDEALIEYQISADGFLVVVIDDSLRIIVLVEAGEQMLRLIVFAGSGDASRQQKLEFVKHINDEIRVIGATLLDDDDFAYYSTYPYQDGISARAFIENLYRFAITCYQAVALTSEGAIK